MPMIACLNMLGKSLISKYSMRVPPRSSNITFFILVRTQSINIESFLLRTFVGA